MTKEEQMYREERQLRAMVDCNLLTTDCVTTATVAKRLGIREKWKTFETLWKRKNMRSDYTRALSQIQIQIIHLFFKNFLRTYTHVRENFYNFICISVSSVSFNPQN